MTKGKGPYRAYLLRLWRVSDGESVDWRATLEDAHTGERHGFPTLEDLVTFFRLGTGMNTPAGIRENDEEEPQTGSESKGGLK